MKILAQYNNFSMMFYYIHEFEAFLNVLVITTRLNLIENICLMFKSS